MFNRQKTNDPLDGLICEAEGILKERAALLEKIGKAEGELREADAQVARARGRVGAEEFEAAQKEGGLAVASGGAQQALAEAELRAKSARFRLQGLQAGLPAIQNRLEAVWAAVEQYRQEFEGGKILGLMEEFNQGLAAWIRLVYKARALSNLQLNWGPGAPFHPVVGLARLYVTNPFTPKHYIDGQFIQDGNHLKDSTKRWVDDPDAVALNQAICGVRERVRALDSAIKGTGIQDIEPGAESRENAREEPGEDTQRD